MALGLSLVDHPFLSKLLGYDDLYGSKSITNAVVLPKAMWFHTQHAIKLLLNFIVANLVKKLTFNQVDALATLLDGEPSGVKNCYHLALRLGFTEKDTNAMRRDGTGESHHAKDFLDYFQVYPLFFSPL